MTQDQTTNADLGSLSDDELEELVDAGVRKGATLEALNLGTAAGDELDRRVAAALADATNEGEITTPAAEEAAAAKPEAVTTLAIANRQTGEVVELGTAADALELVGHISTALAELDVRELEVSAIADAFDGLETATLELESFKRHLVAELARRADARGKRTLEIDGVKYEVNAPTEETYDPAELKAALLPLVEERILDDELLDEIIVTPKPKPPEPRVDRRAINALKRSDDPKVLAAIASVRKTKTTRRTAKIVERVLETKAVNR